MIDIGLNLINHQFHGKEKEILDNAFLNGVTGIICTGTSLISVQKTYEYISKNNLSQCVMTAGLHPHNAKFWEQDKAHIIEFAQKSQVVAIGECGLDYDRMYSSKQEQCHAFEQQLDLALNVNKPVFLHLRPHYENNEDTAMHDFCDIIYPYIKKGLKGVVHCFTGDKKMLSELLKMNLYIGITGWVSDPKRGTVLKNLISDIPDNRIMIETDAPYLKPKHVKSLKSIKNNEPAYLKYIAEYVAELKGTSVTELSEITNRNVYDLFKWVPE